MELTRDAIIQNYKMLDMIRTKKHIDSTVETFKECLGISRTTADKMISGLKDAQLICRQDRRTQIVRERGIFLGISIGSTHTRTYVIGLDFEPFSRDELRTFSCLGSLEDIEGFEASESDAFSLSFATPSGQGKNFGDTCRMISEIVSAFLHQAGTGDFPLLGIGFALAGPVDYEAKIWRYAPRFTDIRDISLMDLIGYDNFRLGGDLGVFFSLENNAKAAMISEYQYLLEKNNGNFHEDIALIYIGRGLSSACVIDGTLLRGSHSLSGEVGHLQVFTKDANGEEGGFCTIEECLPDQEIDERMIESYYRYLPFVLNTINCVLGIDRAILIGHSIRKSTSLIPTLMARRMQFTVISTQRYCRPESGRGIAGTAALGAAIESYMCMCSYDGNQPEDRINLAKVISW